MKKFRKVLAMLLAICLCFNTINIADAKSKVVTVTTQKQLKKALQEGNVAKIIFKTKKALKITIPKNKKAKNIILQIDAPNAAINNKATFKSIALKGDKVNFTESASGNKITVYAEELFIAVDKNASVAELKIIKKVKDSNIQIAGSIKTLTTRSDKTSVMVSEEARVEEIRAAKKNSKLELTADGTVEKVTITGKQTNLEISGNTANINVTIASKENVITTSVPVKAEVKKTGSANLTLNKGAEGSEINLDFTTSITVENKTKEEILITQGDKAVAVESGKKEEVRAEDINPISTPIPTNNSGNNEGTTTPNGNGSSNQTPEPSQSPDSSETPEPTSSPSSDVTAEEIKDGYRLSNNYFQVETGKYGQITSLKIVGDEFNTNYVMDISANPKQDTLGHQWMGELMFQSKIGSETEYSPNYTNVSESGRKVELQDNKVVVTYENAQEERGIQDFKLIETYSLQNDKLQWDIKVENTNQEILTIGDFGLPLAFREYWTGEGEVYETSTVDHSFVGKDSSYLYVTRPSGKGHFLLMTPDVETDAGFEYQDHWVWEQNRREDEKNWCMDQGDWANGLNVFYIHSDAIKSENKGYLENTSLVLEPGESKTYTFHFTGVKDETEMKSVLYKEDIIDAVAVPGMVFSLNMPAQMYLHTKLSKDDISFEYQCPHNNGLHTGTNNINTSDQLPCHRDETTVTYKETKVINGEQYHIYNIKFGDLGHNNIIVNYNYQGTQKQTVLQFYMMASIEEALALHADFIVDKTQWDAPGEIQDKVFDDWMMDTKSKRGAFDGYWGWGDDWGYVHGEFLAAMNSYNPVEKQVKALDEYLDTAIWNGLLQEHQEDYLIHDFLMSEPNNTPTYRGFAYPHIYNTYFSMYQIARNYPDLIDYKESADTYLMRAYNIMKALYSETVGYNWATGLMGESSTPDIIAALKERGYREEAESLETIMEKKFANFSSEKYPYISEYPYDNTSEEAIYTLAKMYGNNEIMSMVDEKTRACRGIQPIWYHYGNPVTICGENWFNFQYTASLAGYCMDDWLRLQDNGMSSEEMGLAERINYAGKLANLTVINSGQIDADAENIGTVSWTYQSEMGNYEAFGTGGGKLHNGWRQMSGEADLALYGALQILSADVAIDPVFGLVGYGCQVTQSDNSYTINPLDGLHRRLNLINNKVSIELVQDKYTKATISTDGREVSLNIENVTKSAHDLEMNLAGMKAGTYKVMYDGAVVGSFETDGKETKIQIPITNKNAVLTILPGELLTNSKFTIEAGEAQKLAISEEMRLNGTAKDSAWLHRYPDVTWSIESQPDGAQVTIEEKNNLATGVKVDKTGTYVFQLTAVGYQQTVSDTIEVMVENDKVLPETLASYDFEVSHVDTENRIIKDTSGEGYNAEIKGKLKLTEKGKDNSQAIEMGGEIGGYVKLPSAITNRVEETTIALDVNLSKIQNAETRLLEFGDMDGNYFYLSFVNGNELSINITNMETGNIISQSAGIMMTSNYWKNIAVTLKENTAILYVDGIERTKIENCDFSFEKFSDVQRNFIGRSYNESTPWLAGVYDNFIMLSKALSSQEIKDRFGNDTPITVEKVMATTVITSVGNAPKLPEQVKVSYSDGTEVYKKVTWETVSQDQYQSINEFTVNGEVEGITEKVQLSVKVVNGEEKNIALLAEPSAIINTPQDLGGVVGLNDGYEPANSNDKSHGVWHNWLGNQTAEAWVQYDWNEEVLITGTDAYYFTDGNFAPATAAFQYKDADGNWKDVESGTGFGTQLNQYNYTNFEPISTTAFRMLMMPKTLGCGVIEWKVYGYAQASIADKLELRNLINLAKTLDSKLFTDGYAKVETALVTTEQIESDKKAEQAAVDMAVSALKDAIMNLKPVDNNYAYLAAVSTSFISSWQKLNGVNDSILVGKGSSYYGTWGNTSEYETVTYTWSEKVKLDRTDIHFWYDGDTPTAGGIKIPKAYQYEYLDDSGNWIEILDTNNYAIDSENANIVQLNGIETTALRVTMWKQENDSNGVGIREWQVFVGISQSQETILYEDITNKTKEELPIDSNELEKKEIDKAQLKTLIDEAIQKQENSYTAETWKIFSDKLNNTQQVYESDYVNQSIVDKTAEEMRTAISGLKEIESLEE